MMLEDVNHCDMSDFERIAPALSKSGFTSIALWASHATANGANAMQAPWNGGNNQQWRLNNLGNGRYQIINRGTGTALDGMGRTAVGSTAGLWAPNGNTNNQWTITAA